MAKLTGTLRDGSAFELNVNARTKRLRLYQHELATLDLSALASAPALEICETGFDRIAIPTLGPLAKCAALTNLSLAIPVGTDLAPLGECKALRHLDLRLHDDGPFSVAPLAKLGALESLSLSFKGAPQTIDLAPLRAVPLQTLSLAHIANSRLDFTFATKAFRSFYVDNAHRLTELDTTALAGTQLEYFLLLACHALRHVDLAPLAGLPLQRVSIVDVPVEDLALDPLGNCTSLRDVQVLQHATRFLDVTALAKLASLTSLDVDGKDAPYLSGDPKSIPSPAIRAWRSAGRLSMD
jgi:hypothetical protein